LGANTPPNLVLDKSSNSGHASNLAMNPGYTQYFTSNRMSECPILRFDLLDTSNNPLSNPSITVTDTNVAA